MSVAGGDNDGSTVFFLQKLFGRASLQSGGEDSDSKDVNYVIVGSSSVVVLIVLCVFICLCRKKRKRRRFKKGRVISTSTLTTSCPTVYNIHTRVEPVELRTTEDVTRRYQRSVSNLSGKHPGKYLVPISVLPPDFDYSSSEVEVSNDFVILKDLSLLERYSSAASNGNGVVNAAYEPQESYNQSTSNGSIPSISVSERYQKQAPYNPTFY